jgi:hypothetical protein
MAQIIDVMGIILSKIFNHLISIKNVIFFIILFFEY